jgi:xylose isomerase
VRHAVLTPFFGRLRDRFAEYHEPLPIAEKIRRAASIPGVEGVEMIYPDECMEAAEVRDALACHGVEVAAVNVNLKGDPGFVRGALSSPDPAVRTRALELIAGAQRLAGELGCGRVTCAPLADGYDYPFQTDYRLAWRRAVETLGQASAGAPEIMLHVEHKPAEPRTRGLVDTASKAVRMAKDIASPNVGVTFNAGHALYDGGNAASAFAEVLVSQLPYYIHFGDATNGWDWDLVAGSHHPWQWAQFLFCLREAGYTGWLTADTLPVRQDAIEVFAANIRLTNKILAWLDGRGLPTIEELAQCLPPPA